MAVGLSMLLAADQRPLVTWFLLAILTRACRFHVEVQPPSYLLSPVLAHPLGVQKQKLD